MAQNRSFSVATLNVHMWVDGNCVDNIDRVVQLIKKHQPDILCFQETTHPVQNDFQRMVPEYGHVVSLNGCSILSKFKMAELFPKETRDRSIKFQRFVCAEIHIPDCDKPVNVTCLHLNYMVEPKRLIEADKIREVTAQLFEENSPQIWTGDFNAVTREDYSNEEWDSVTSVRERNSWELPKTELTTKVKGFGFIDCWAAVDKPAPIKTCRFNTRIDYVYATPSLIKAHRLVSVQHVDDPASDHNLVIATFEK